MTDSTIGSPEQVEAEVYLKAMTSGRSKAVALSCARADETSVRCIVKLAANLSGLSPLPYLLEWVATALGNRLGINVPKPFEVLLTPAFAQSLEEPVKGLVLSSLGAAFGSEFHEAPFIQWVSGKVLPMELREAAAELLAFDVFIHNPDRRRTNPNVLVSRDRLLAYDHGDAFSFLYALEGNAVEDALVSEVVQGHVFAQLFGRKVPSLARFRAAVEGLGDDDFSAIAQHAPAAWQTGPATGKLETILDIMRKRRDAVARWLPQVEAWIQK